MVMEPVVAQKCLETCGNIIEHDTAAAAEDSDCVLPLNLPVCSQLEQQGEPVAIEEAVERDPTELQVESNTLEIPTVTVAVECKPELPPVETDIVPAEVKADATEEPVPGISKEPPKKKKRPYIKKPRFPCTVCNKVFLSQYYLDVHSRKHNRPRNYACETCGKTFTQSSGLKDHLRVHTGEKPYSCSNCDATFTTSGSRNKHQKKCIAGTLGTSEKAELAKARAAARKEKRIKTKQICSVCQKLFSSEHALKVHFRTHTGIKPYQCPHCPKAFCQRVSLQTHIRGHTGEKPFICGQCGKSCSQKSGLEKHLRTHTAVKPYVCDLCGKAFAVSSNLRAHMRVHSGDKPYSCPVCNKAFATSSTCNKHFKRACGGTTTVYQAQEAAKEYITPTVLPETLQTQLQQNTKEALEKDPIIETKDNTCTVCHKKFRSKHHLRIHFRKHTGLKPYQCPHCPKKFSQSGSLSSHIRVHTGEKPFSCLQCGKACSQKGDLKKHMRTHTADKPYTCNICQKSFSISSNYKVHLRTHSGDKPYTCSVCNKAFTTSSGCKKHFKRCSGAKPAPLPKVPKPTVAPPIEDQQVKRLSHPETSHFTDARDYSEVREYSNTGVPEFHTPDSYWSKAIYMQYIQQDILARQSHDLLPRQSEDMLVRQSQDILARQSQDFLSRQSEVLLTRQAQELLSRQSQDMLSRQSQELLARQTFEDSSSCAHWR